MVTKTKGILSEIFNTSYPKVSLRVSLGVLAKVSTPQGVVFASVIDHSELSTLQYMISGLTAVQYATDPSASPESTVKEHMRNGVVQLVAKPDISRVSFINYNTKERFDNALFFRAGTTFSDAIQKFAEKTGVEPSSIDLVDGKTGQPVPRSSYGNVINEAEWLTVSGKNAEIYFSNTASTASSSSYDEGESPIGAKRRSEGNTITHTTSRELLQRYIRNKSPWFKAIKHSLTSFLYLEYPDSAFDSLGNTPQSSEKYRQISLIPLPFLVEYGVTGKEKDAFTPFPVFNLESNSQEMLNPSKETVITATFKGATTYLVKKRSNGITFWNLYIVYSNQLLVAGALVGYQDMDEYQNLYESNTSGFELPNLLITPHRNTGMHVKLLRPRLIASYKDGSSIVIDLEGKLKRTMFRDLGVLVGSLSVPKKVALKDFVRTVSALS